MFNPYQPILAKIVAIKNEVVGVRLFKLRPTKKIYFQPGQIVFASVAGFGEAPFAICSHPNEREIEICVRQVGRLTSRAYLLKEGDLVNLRGPYGNHWPLEKEKNYLLIVGGLGLLPLRSLILAKDKLLGEESKLQIFYGAKSPNDFLFKEEFEKWKKAGVDLQLTVDKTCPDWTGCVGMVTTLFDQHELSSNAKALLCGPPAMFKAVVQKLKEKRLADHNIYMSLERRMHCGIGVCQHCAIGSQYVCKDGPIFNYEDLRSLPDVF